MIHLADVTRIDDTCFRFVCRETGAVIRHWASYLRDGDKLTIWEKEPPVDSECHQADHLNAKKGGTP